MDEIYARLLSGLNSDLPGHDAFLEMSGYKRLDIEKARQLVPPPRESAVLALIYPRFKIPHIMLMERPEYEGVHSGQISFPGGKSEEYDASLQDTALREFSEETGAHAVIEILGQLTPVYIPPSKLMVTPFVGFTHEIGPLLPDPREVASLIECPLDHILRPDIIKHREQFIQIMGGKIQVPYFELQGHAVWGATAMMIAELRVLLSAKG
ncbi:MAG TPA: CoA pyrophosphatase [Flavobacteriales bacterium]|nr:CoA pyrophosphatase [Flavobacteriales bacterium]